MIDHLEAVLDEFGTGITATEAAVLKSLKNGSLTPTKRPIGYGKMTHAELCRWVGVTPHLFRNRKKVGGAVTTAGVMDRILSASWREWLKRAPHPDNFGFIPFAQ